jgi:hypothetical protein
LIKPAANEAQSIFANYISKELSIYAPCMNYPMLRNTITMDIALEYDGSIRELWKITNDNASLDLETVNKIKNNGYATIPIYQINSNWIVENKENKYLKKFLSAAQKFFNKNRLN